MRYPIIERSFGKSLLMLVLATGFAHAQDNVTSSSIRWSTSYAKSTDESTQAGKPILVRITASWCGPCQQMKQLTFNDSRVVQLVESNFLALSIDADQFPELVTRFRVEAYPTTLVIAPDQTILKRLTGYQSAESLISSILPLATNLRPSETSASASDAISALEPANTVRFAFDGLCLVSLLEQTRVRKGSAEFTADYRGQTVCFESDEQRQKFLKEPDRYWPVANGQCLVTSRERALAGQGNPRMAVTWRGKIWMFSNRECQRRFIQAPSYYSGEM